MVIIIIATTVTTNGYSAAAVRSYCPDAAVDTAGLRHLMAWAGTSLITEMRIPFRAPTV
jgi:hypothetical protein